MRCAWCPERATVRGLVACCYSHTALLDDLERARWLLRRETTIVLPSGHQFWSLAAAVEERDARELRGEPPSMEGWTIFDGSAM